MKKTVSLLTNLLIASTLFWGVSSVNGEIVGGQEIVKEPASPAGYCHMQFPPMRDEWRRTGLCILFRDHLPVPASSPLLAGGLCLGRHRRPELQPPGGLAPCHPAHRAFRGRRRRRGVGYALRPALGGLGPAPVHPRSGADCVHGKPIRLSAARVQPRA